MPRTPIRAGPRARTTSTWMGSRTFSIPSPARRTAPRCRHETLDRNGARNGVPRRLRRRFGDGTGTCAGATGADGQGRLHGLHQGAAAHSVRFSAAVAGERRAVRLRRRRQPGGLCDRAALHMTQGTSTRRRSGAAPLLAIAVILLALTGAAATAAPYRPSDDSMILERVPARSDLERLAPLRAAVAARPADLGAALALATGYIEIGRRNSDPRFIAYAQATLQSWLARPHPPEPPLALSATSLQYLHQFDGSLALLERALALAPFDGQAWLTRAA